MLMSIGDNEVNSSYGTIHVQLLFSYTVLYMVGRATLLLDRWVCDLTAGGLESRAIRLCKLAGYQPVQIKNSLGLEGNSKSHDVLEVSDWN